MGSGAKQGVEKIMQGAAVPSAAKAVNENRLLSQR
jgi:hypothetical protein